MQNVPIKFRGIEDIKDGKYVYGDYVTRESGCAIRFRENENLFNMHEYEVAVKPETVAQLVGYDVNGEEVYEGDTLIRNPIEQSPIPLQFALGYLGEPEKIKTIAKMHPSIECKFYTLERGDLNARRTD